jgi:hypothetical protein
MLTDWCGERKAQLEEAGVSISGAVERAVVSYLGVPLRLCGLAVPIAHSVPSAKSRVRQTLAPSPIVMIGTSS